MPISATSPLPSMRIGAIVRSNSRPSRSKRIGVGWSARPRSARAMSWNVWTGLPSTMSTLSPSLTPAR
jgi:hypothetical protein